MELDEIRQRWQHAAPPPAAPELSNTALRQLLSRQHNRPVARLERNLWLEVGLLGLIMAFSAGALLVVRDAYNRTMLGWLLLVSLLMLPYYARKHKIIKSLRDPAGSVREHTHRQLSSLRALMRLYYRATLWTLPVTFGIGLVFTSRKIVAELSGPKMWVGLGILGAFYLLVGVVMYFAMRGLTRWWLQKLYGQHLDQLESSLAELEEPATEISR